VKKEKKKGISGTKKKKEKKRNQKKKEPRMGEGEREVASPFWLETEKERRGKISSGKKGERVLISLLTKGGGEEGGSRIDWTKKGGNLSTAKRGEEEKSRYRSQKGGGVREGGGGEKATYFLYKKKKIWGRGGKEGEANSRPFLRLSKKKRKRGKKLRLSCLGESIMKRMFLKGRGERGKGKASVITPTGNGEKNSLGEKKEENQPLLSPQEKRRYFGKERKGKGRLKKEKGDLLPF